MMKSRIATIGLTFLASLTVFGPSGVHAKTKSHTYCISTTSGPKRLLVALPNKKNVALLPGKCDGASKFVIEDLSGGNLKKGHEVRIKTKYGKYVEVSRNGKVTASSSDKRLISNRFIIERPSSSKIRFKSALGSGYLYSLAAILKGNGKNKKARAVFRLISPSKKESVALPGQGLKGCLSKLPAKYKTSGLQTLAAKYSGDRKAFADQIYKDFVQEKLNTIETWAKAEVQAEFKKKRPFRSKATTSIEDLTANAWAEIKKLSRQPGMEPFRCVVDHVLDDLFVKLRKDIIRAAKSAKKRMERVWEDKVRDEVRKKASEVMGKAAKRLLDEERARDFRRLRTLARQVALEKIFGQVEEISKQLAAYNKAKANGDKGAATAAYNQLTPRLRGSLTIDQRIDIAVETFGLFTKEKLDAFREKHVHPVIKKGLNTVSTYLSVGEHGIDGLCGLIPEVGAGVCAIFTTCVRLAWTWALEPTLYEKSTTYMKDRTDAVVEFGEKMVKREAKNQLTDREIRRLEQQVFDGKQVFGGEKMVGFLKTIIRELNPAVAAALKSANEYKVGVLNLLLATEGSAAGRVSPVRTPAQRKGKTKARTIKGTRAVRGRRR